jgi:mono/diheme cytochrome c family protein
MNSPRTVFRLRQTIIFSVMLFCLASPCIANEAAINWRLPKISATDFHGKPVDLQALGQAGKGLVVFFHSTTCPVSKQYGPTIARLEKGLRQQGLGVVIVNPVATDPESSIRELLAEFSADTTYIQDKNEVITAALDARSTTEVFLFDKALTLKYRGAVDDQFAVGAALEKPRHNYLTDAVTAMLGGAEIAQSVTDPSGCKLDAKPVASDKLQITYHNQVERIVQKNCVSCHRDNGLAPFSLESYDDVKAHRGMIRKEVARGQMPPWFAAPATYESHPGWLNDRTLSEADKSTLLTWLSSNMPEGDLAEAPLPLKFPDTGWQIGKPDIVLQLPAPVKIQAQGKMPYQHRTVETKLTEDKWIQAVELRPTDKSVVHHVLVFIAPPETKGDDEAGNDDVQERRGFFAGYVPGTSAMVFPEGYGKRVPKGSRLRFQIHYTPNGKATEDQLEFAMTFCKKPPEHEVKVIGVANPGINIPAGAANHVEIARQNVPTDIELVAFMPHMHVRGKAFKYEVLFPDGQRQTVLDVPRYDFNWQLRYRLAKPIAVPAGSTIIATAAFDNSEANRANPDPSKNVQWGQQTDEEMMLGYVEYEVKGPAKAFGGAGGQVPGPLARLIGGKNREETQARFFNLLDTDKDNYLTRQELGRLQQFIPRLKANPDRLDTMLQTLDTNDDSKLSREEMKGIRNLAGG